MNTGYAFTVTCRRCGGLLAHKADGVPSTNAARAVAECTECGVEHLLEVRLVVAETPWGARRPRRAAGVA